MKKTSSYRIGYVKGKTVCGILYGERFTQKLLEIIYPLTVYYLIVLMAMVILRLFFGITTESYMLRQLFSALITIPCIFVFFYRGDRIRFAGRTVFEYLKKDLSGVCISAAVIIAAALFISTGLNNIIVMSPLPGYSPGYSEAVKNFYGSTVFLELAASGIVTPMLEELLFRGIIYGRLRQVTDPGKGMALPVFFSAFIFAIMHFNLVQFIYAFFLGIVLTLFMEWIGHLWAAVLAHMAANILAVLRTEYGLFSFMTDKSLFAWSLSLLILFMGLVFLGLFYRLVKKNIVFADI